MTDYVITKKKIGKNTSTREELELLDSASLIDKIIQLEAHNFQLKRIIKKAEDAKTVSASSKSSYKQNKPFDFSRCFKRHILLKFFYLGWNYHGFVEQEDNNNTVEEHVFNALKMSCCIESRQSANYHRCGRTDKGVSAFSQVISLDVRSCLEVAKQDRVEEELDYCKILNRLLPADIRCYAWSPVENAISARFDCKRRTYKYFFPRGYLNVNAMNEAASYIVGTHDFRNFCKMDVANGVVRFDRTVRDARVVMADSGDTRGTSCKTLKQRRITLPRDPCQFLSRDPSVYLGFRMHFVLNMSNRMCYKTLGTLRKYSSMGVLLNRLGYDMCQFVITSQAFLWHQIRCIMGVLLLVGQAKEDPTVVLDLLNVESCPRKPQYSLAHELPLNLYDCHFDDVRWIYNKSELLLIVKGLEQNWTLHAIKSTMIKDMLDELKVLLDEDEDSMNAERYTLLQGAQSTKYQPLMERLTCESLENRISHFEKRRKIQAVEEKDDRAMETRDT